MDIDTNHYLTRDLPESAFLYTSGIKLIKTEIVGNGRRICFVFEDRNKCEELVEKFMQKEGLVDAKTYSDSLRTLKDIVFNRI